MRDPCRMRLTPVFGWTLLRIEAIIPEKQQFVLAKGAVADWQSRCPGGT